MSDRVFLLENGSSESFHHDSTQHFCECDGGEYRGATRLGSWKLSFPRTLHVTQICRRVSWARHLADLDFNRSFCVSLVFHMLFMAPAKDGKKSGGRSITDFFSPWVRRAPAPATNPEPAPAPPINNDTSSNEVEGGEDEDDGDVIVVKQPTSEASPKRGPGRPRKNANSQSPKSSASGTPQKRGPGRPRKSPSESQSQDSTAQKRGPGRPRKSESQQMRDNQLRPSISNDNNNDNNSVHSTPRKYNINPLDGKADVTPTKDSPLRSSEETPGKRRIVAAVEVHSPKGKNRTVKGEEMGNMLAGSFGGGERAMCRDAVEVDDTGGLVPGAFVDERGEQTEVSVDETPQETAVKPPKTTAPPASFSSISTLTTLPNSSAATATPNPLNSSTSSRRVTQDGLKGVTNSDSEDDSSSSDEEDPFRSLSSFCQPKKRKSVEPLEAPPPKAMKTTSARAKKQNFFKSFASPPKKVYKNTLKSLVAQQEQWQQSAAMIASMESAVEESAKRQEQLKAVDNDAPDSAALVDAAGSNDEDRERMIHALERTEALREKDHYRFFLDDNPLWSDFPFPVDSLPDEKWAEVYKTPKSRYQACITGFAAYLASSHPLPVQITGWMVVQLMYEQDEVLCEAYVEILRIAAAFPTSISDSASSLSSIFKTRSFFENGNKEAVARSGLPPGLKDILRVAQFCAPMTDSVVPEAVPQQTCAAFLDLMLINIDERVKANLDLSLAVTKCIEGMLDLLPEEAFSKLIPEAILMMFGTSDLSEKNRYRAISCLPAGTVRTNKIRRRLALECFSSATDRKSPDPQDWPNSILRSLARNPTFQVSESTDYSLLQELTRILDIAISAGWTPYDQIIPGAPSGPWGKLPEPSEAESLHNLQVDRIVKRLTGIMAKIREAGTSHLGRVEAKVTIERLVRRLELQVRSRKKPPKGVFNEGFKQARLVGFGVKEKQGSQQAQQTPKAKVSFKEEVEVMKSEDRPGSADDDEETVVKGDGDVGGEKKSMVDSGTVMKSSPPI